MKHRRAIGYGILILTLFGIVLGLRLLLGRNVSTDTRSATLPNDAAKIDFLNKYLKMFSPIQATEFHIVYKDSEGGFQGIPPGPSDWDIQVVMKMQKENCPAWTTGLEATKDEVDLSWGYALLTQEKRWSIKSIPAVYTRGRTMVAVFEPEGIVSREWYNTDAP